MAGVPHNLKLVWPEALQAPAEAASRGESASDRLFRREAFRAPARKNAEPPEAYSRKWFEQIERHRYSRHGAWIPRSLEFSRHRGETVLCLGEGLGTDWLQYAQHGAQVIVCSPSQEQLALVRQHFELRDQQARFIHATPQAIPLDLSSVDVVSIRGLLYEVDKPSDVLSEIYRVLRPGGKIIAVAPAHYNATYWSRLLCPWVKFLEPESAEMLRGVKARQLRRDFFQFTDHKISKRHLRRSVLPQLWRIFPLPLLERLIGQVLVIKAFKPVSAALSESSASIAAA